MLTAPGPAPAGVTTFSRLGLFERTCAALPPNLTSQFGAKFCPAIDTCVPPDRGPLEGLTKVMTGSGAGGGGGAGTYVKAPCATPACWLALTTRTLTGPAVCACGVTAVNCVLLLKVVCASALPNLARQSGVKFPPVIITCVPPLTGPLEGLTDVMKGTDAGGGRSEEHTSELQSPYVI